MAFLKIIPRQSHPQRKVMQQCRKCRQWKKTVCFSGKYDGTKYEGWCVICRRAKGLDQSDKLGRPFGARAKLAAAQTQRYDCLRCGCRFESPIWGNNQHYHLCEHCRAMVASMEQASI